MKNEKEINKAIESRIPSGVPQDLMLDLFKELGYGKRELNRFYKWMYGQTCGLVGTMPIYYACDIRRFLLNNCDMSTKTLD